SIITFTKVIDLEATYNFNVTCNPSSEENYERYSGEVMKATLDAMVGKDNLTDYKTDYAERDGTKQAIIVGTGKINDRESIYSAQLWIGKSSTFTVEGEMLGFAGDEADKTFADIIASAGPKPAAPEAAEKEAEKDAEKPAEEPAAKPAE
ncbi:MAG: hypothetical protein KJ667_03950, partial [Alphaproteobacteria bacterium]|nr:hypothetical protein [Alphaproteobacteria bacterium]